VGGNLYLTVQYGATVVNYNRYRYSTLEEGHKSYSRRVILITYFKHFRFVDPSCLEKTSDSQLVA
jgi:hypothetical protein